VNFNSPVIYTVQAEDGSSRDYTVTVYVFDRNTSKQITGFYFIFPNSPAEGAAGIINETAKTIAVTLPAGTDLRSLAPVVYHTGVSVSPISGAPEDFTDSVTNPRTYTVTARDGSSQEYKVAVFIAKASSSAITHIDFGIPNATVTIGSVPGADGKLPIVITVSDPDNPVDLTTLTPKISHTGVSITGDGIPAGGSGTVTGTPVDFTAPVNYTVTAEDGSTQDYTIAVIHAAPPDPSRALARIDGFYFNDPLVIGVIDQGAKTITATVPYNTDLRTLTPTIYFSGKSIRQGTGSEFESNPAVIGANFSNPVTCWVSAQDGTTRVSYQVTVTKLKGTTNQITALAFEGISGAEITTVIDPTPDASGRIPITVTVPVSANLAALKPVITHTGASIMGNGILAGGSGTVTGTAVNFTDPVTYTVTAEDGKTQTYTITATKAPPPDSSRTLAKIDGFYFNNPLVTGVINEEAKTITATVPYGTNLGTLTPTIYFSGKSIRLETGPEQETNPAVIGTDFSNSVTYTVSAQDGTTQVPYQVTVTKLKGTTNQITALAFEGISGAEITTKIGSTPDASGKIPIEVTVPVSANLAALKPVITHTGASITGSGLSNGGPGTVTGTAVNFTDPVTDPVTYTVTAEDGKTRTYTITVTTPPLDPSWTLARIDGFYFNNPLVIGVINEGAKTITATVPYNTDLRTLTPTIYFSGKSIRQGTGSEQATNPAVIGADFSNSVTYTVSAQDGTTTPVSYRVTVKAETKPQGTTNQITGFTFVGISGEATTAVIGSTPDASGKIPIEVTVPVSTNLSALTPVITHTGGSITGNGIPAGSSGSGTVTGTPVNFTAPVTYTVTAEDGTPKEYLVTLRAEDNNAKAITGFYFTDPLAVGEINEGAKTITVSVPYGTNLEALKPTVYYTGVSLGPVSGRVNTFSFPTVYTVTARNGTVQPYTVQVSVRQSSTKDITGFSFSGVVVVDTVVGSIPGPDGKIPIAVTVSDRTNIAALVPTISHTGKTISPASGAVGNFSGPVSYRVTAEDGSTKDYTVSVHLSGNSSKVISGFAFTSIPAIGQVDQEAHTIEVVVPYSTAINSLRPTITYIGASIGFSGATPQSVHPFIDDPRNFSNPLVYRVTAADGTSQDYRVTVSVENQNLKSGVSFSGISDLDFLSASFDQTTGLVTIRVKDGQGYTAPYEWYLDGRKYPISATESVLILKTSGLKTGRHEVVGVVTGTNNRHYTNKIYFLVGE
jgi:hypothetical protein